jgi:hypothetical protein
MRNWISRTAVVAWIGVMTVVVGSIQVRGREPGDAPWRGIGRIALSSDGNEHDHDDWAATPLSLALLASRGLQDRLVLYTYSDHVWGSDHDKPGARDQMTESAVEGGKRFGFTRTRFVEAVADPEAAYAAMAEAIDRSTADDPLIIVAAGPMQVVGEGLNRARKDRRGFVTVISHSSWNDNHAALPYRWEKHDGWTWSKMKSAFGGDGVRFVRIADQNGGRDYEGLMAPRAAFDWLKTSPARERSDTTAGAWDWLHGRLLSCVKKGEIDASDAGMIVYLLTGKEKTSPDDARILMEGP